MSKYESLCKASLLAKQPEGSIGQILTGGDEDKLYDGLAKDNAATMEYIERLSAVRDPHKTVFIEELEADYGIAPNNSMDDDERRQQLAMEVYKTGGTGSLDDLRDALTRAGFTNVNVYDNDPIVAPQSLWGNYIAARCYDPMAARCSATMTSRCYEWSDSGEFIVNGKMLVSSIVYSARCTDPMTATCSDPMTARCSAAFVQEEEIKYNPTKWFQKVILLGGEITIEDGAIVAMEEVSISAIRADEFRRIVLKYKPLDTMAAAKIIFSDIYYDEFGDTEVFYDEFGASEVYYDEGSL